MPREAYAGDAVELAGAGQAPDGMVVTSPQGVARLVEGQPGRPLVYTDTWSVGPYLVRRPRQGSHGAAFTVNLDPAEGDLARLAADEINSRLPGARVLLANSPESLGEALRSIEPVLALGDVILYAVVALALIECLAANRLPSKSSGEK